MTNRVKLDPPFGQLDMEFKDQVFERVGDGPFLVSGYDVNNLPDPTEWASIDPADPYSSMIFIYNEVGGPCFAGSDGTNWRRIQFGAIVS